MSRKYGLRGYLAALRESGEVVDVEREVDSELEMGAVARLCCETGAAVPLFRNVAEVPDFLAVGALVGTSTRNRLARLALALFLDERAPAAALVEALSCARLRPGVPPREVDSAPCKEHVRTGDDVDLARLPTPLIHHGDGGRYVSTLGVMVVRTPDGEWTNWSINRLMMLDGSTCSGSVVPVQHLGAIHQQWRQAGQDMPFAIALGVDPALLYAASMPLPSGASEAEYAGALLDRPVDVVRCASVELEVPADAEIVLEGTASLSQVGSEGPYGDFTGYFHPNYSVPEPVFHVEAVTYRDRAIYPFTCAGEPPSEEHTIWGVASAAEALHWLRDAGLPVTTTWSPFESCNGWLGVAVSPEWTRLGLDAKEFCRWVGEAVWSGKAGDPINSVIVTEDDIDPSDVGELVWAMDSRNERSPGGRLRISDRIGWPMSPYLDTDHFRYHEGWRSDRLIYDCLPMPASSPIVRTGFAHNYPREVRAKVLRNWSSDGFHDLPNMTDSGE